MGSSAEATISTIEKSGNGEAAKTSKTDLGSPLTDKEKGHKGRKAKADKQPRTGAKANKEALEEIKKRLDECALRSDFDKQASDLQRATASVQVFKAQMKLFERKFLAEREFESRLVSTSKVVSNSEGVFENRKNSESTDKSKMTVSLQAAANMKKTL